MGVRPSPATHTAHCDRIRRCVVVVPAHNEDETLAQALGAVMNAVAAVDVPVRVIVVLDACTDQSATRVHPGNEVRNIVSRNVGRARAAGFIDTDDGPHTWYATTDADSRVPEHWLRWQLDLAESGHDAVVGTVAVSDWTGWHPGAGTRFDAHYLLGHDRARDRMHDDHRHVHGANLGVRASLYHQVGGFAAVDRDEDVDLVQRLSRTGRPIAWSAAAPVTTSPRRIGRAPAGFATSLPAIVDAAR